MDLVQPLVSAVVSGLVGGVVTGAVALIVMRVELRWHRADINRAQATADAAHRRIDAFHEPAKS